MKDAAYWINQLGLQKHPEGGYFKETYRSDMEIKSCCLDSGFEGARSISTSIYFLLSGTDFSAFHRIRSDEIWHHYEGSALAIHVVDAKGDYHPLQLGLNSDKGESPQIVVPAGNWFGATVNDSESYALVGCTVAPGFDFKDFEMGNRDELIRSYPAHRAIIERLTNS